MAARCQSSGPSNGWRRTKCRPPSRRRPEPRPGKSVSERLPRKFSFGPHMTQLTTRQCHIEYNNALADHAPVGRQSLTTTISSDSQREHLKVCLSWPGICASMREIHIVHPQFEHSGRSAGSGGSKFSGCDIAPLQPPAFGARAGNGASPTPSRGRVRVRRVPPVSPAPAFWPSVRAAPWRSGQGAVACDLESRAGWSAL